MSYTPVNNGFGHSGSTAINKMLTFSLSAFDRPAAPTSPGRDTHPNAKTFIQKKKQW
jgi:hypothetical protein